MVSSFSGDQTLHLLGHPLGLDPQHAAVVDGAFAEKAGAAIDLFADDAVDGADRGGQVRLGRAEDGDDGHTEGGGEVHGAGVVGEEKVAGAQFGDEFGEAGFADEVAVRGVDELGEGLAEGFLAGRAEEEPFVGLLFFH